ncbi:MAG: orotate phosphoribosyltransferase [Pseudomonadota bacterium]
MSEDDVLAIFREAGALQSGHFILSSGLHSDAYLNKSIVSMYADKTARLCAALAAKATDAFGPVDVVVAPAMGAIIYGYETARHLERPFMFFERVDGDFALRRGFAIAAGAPTLVVEDIVSTGLSARECVAAARREGADVKGLACLVDRSGGEADVAAPMTALATLTVEAWPADALPPHLRDVPAVKPGSRGL